MYNPDNIRKKIHIEYNKLLDLLYRKGPISSKYLELKEILYFFQNEKPNMNEDESKILKNVLIISNGILSKNAPNSKKEKIQKEQCLEIYSIIKK